MIILVLLVVSYGDGMGWVGLGTCEGTYKMYTVVKTVAVLLLSTALKDPIYMGH